MESPYRPPREVTSSEDFAISLEGDAFRFSEDQQRMIGKLSKYLRDIGGLLIFLAVLALVGSAFSMFAVSTIGFMPIMLLQVVNQLLTVIFLFLIGRFMRKASVPLRTISESTDQHLPQLLAAMRSLYTLYGTKILYVLFGMVGSLVVPMI